MFHLLFFIKLRTFARSSLGVKACKRIPRFRKIGPRTRMASIAVKLNTSILQTSRLGHRHSKFVILYQSKRNSLFND